MTNGTVQCSANHLTHPVRPQVGDVGCPDPIGRVGREVPLQQVRGDRQVMLRVGRNLEAPLVLGLDAVPLHQPLYPFIAGRESAQPKLSDHAGTAVSAFEFLVDGLNQRRHLRIGQALPMWPAAALPCPVATFAGRKCTFVINGMPVLRDPRHLSEYASTEIADNFVLWAHIPEMLSAQIGAQ